MPNETILEQVRTPLATALASVAGNVYSFVPETVIPPAVVVVPDSPYLELETINKSTIHAKINFTISVAVVRVIDMAVSGALSEGAFPT